MVSYSKVISIIGCRHTHSQDVVVFSDAFIHGCAGYVVVQIKPQVSKPRVNAQKAGRESVSNV